MLEDLRRDHDFGDTGEYYDVFEASSHGREPANN
jgi:hypothetical protein